MSDTMTNQKREQVQRSKWRRLLLIVQILFPFGLFLAMESGRDGLAVTIAGLFVLSMAALVWVG